MDEIKKRPITPTLRGMKVGDSEKFPICQLCSIRTIIYNNLTQERNAGLDWSIKSDIANGEVTVTRTS